MQRVAVEVGVHGDGGDAQLLAGADDPDGDLAPVGDQDLGEHGAYAYGAMAVTARPLAGRAHGPARPARRFADVRWVAETGSTNADVLALARDGGREGIVLVADHQTAGRGRLGRTWEAPPGASLLVSVLLRPAGGGRRRWPRWRSAVALAEAVEEVAGVAPAAQVAERPRVAGDGVDDRKLAGILAEADWPAGADVTGGWPHAAAERAGRGRRRHRAST